MQWAILTIALAVSTMEVWTTSPLNTLTDENRTHPTAAQNAQLYAARGEHEGMLLFVRAGRRGLEALQPEGSPLGGTIAPPQIYRVGPAALSQRTARTLPDVAQIMDVLHPVAATNLDKDETAVYSVDYRVPDDTPPGGYSGTIKLHSENRHTRSLDVTLEVFDFTLPAKPQLRGVAPLDRESIRRTYAIDNRSLEHWRPVYDALAPWRLSFPVWMGDDLVTMNETEIADATAFKEHLVYAVDAADMAAVDIMAHGRAVHLFPPPLPGDNHDPLHVYLDDMLDWLGSHDWRDRAYAAVMPTPPRHMWQPARALYFQVWRASKGLPRLLVLSPHPYWERFTDWWAAPLPELSPEIVQHMTEGTSMVEFQPLDAHLTASSSGVQPATGIATQPQDAGDGALASVWRPGKAAKGAPAPWLQLAFDAPRPVKHVTVIWSGSEPEENLGVETSYDAQAFAPAAVAWKHRAVNGPFAHGVSKGTLKYEKTLRALRIIVAKSQEDQHGIAEVLLHEEPEHMEPAAIPSVKPWLHLTPDTFPSPAPGAHPAELRLLPWVCYARGLTGFLLPGLTQWPQHWQPGEVPPTDPWPASPYPEAALLYPGPNVPLPALRLMRLRDGMEDYGYLAALEDAVQDKRLAAEDARQLVNLQLYGPEPTTDALDALASGIEEVRIRIGRALASLPEAPESP
ncbi:MAG: DUF4091 domain-containing protein [Candidatus Hydrogenedentota bacterium]